MADYNPDTVTFPVEDIGGVPHIDVSEHYEKHRRSKNYVALLTGRDPTYKWKRKFLKFVWLDSTPYIPLADVSAGLPVEFAFIYYSGSGNRYPRLKGFYMFKGVEETEDGKVAVFERVTEKWLTDFFTERENAKADDDVKEVQPDEELTAIVMDLVKRYGADAVRKVVEEVTGGL